MLGFIVQVFMVVFRHEIEKDQWIDRQESSINSALKQETKRKNSVEMVGRLVGRVK